MGILNVTPDSFSDGGRYLDPDAALAQARRLVEEGADMLDVGGESTRPGAAAVDAASEVQRVIPVVQALREAFDVPISVDTSKPEVMREAVAAGADLINDVRALREPGALEAALASGAAVCLMHMLGEPRTMQQAPHYGDVVGEVRDFLAVQMQACLDAGLPTERLLVDPGFGFGKTLAHNLSLLKHLDRLGDLGAPLLVGMSRKTMIGQILDLPVEERQTGSIAAALFAAEKGAAILRVHDVRPTVEALQVLQAVQAAE
ncbi:MAG: dihydropteroate synthase [Gammaproteobacteria bacterium]|jgi:dihydropteroate synthase